jgi:hypothetical protein
MNANELKTTFDRWKQAEQDWIERTLDLAKGFYEARQNYKTDNDFGIWLEKNSINIQKNDRAAFIHLGAHLEIAREILQTTKSRSPRLIWKASQNRFPINGKPNSSKSKKRFAKKDQRVFARHLLAALRRKRKEAHDVKITRQWRPESVNKIELIKILDWIEYRLDDFINHRAVSFDNGATITEQLLEGDSHVEENERGIGKFDA